MSQCRIMYLPFVVAALSGLLAERDRLVEEQASAIPRFEDPARPRHRAARLMGSRHRTGAGFTLSETEREQRWSLSTCRATAKGGFR